MCTAPAVFAVVGIAGAAVSAYGQYQSGQAQKQAARAQEQSLLRGALETEQRGDEIARARRELAANQRSRARVALAAQGVNVATGTAARVEDEIARVSTKEEENIRKQAKREALGLRERASIAAFEGEQAAAAGGIGAAGTFISGAGSVASRWYSQTKTPGKG